MLFDGDSSPQDTPQQTGEAATVTMSRGIGTLFEEVEDRLRYLESMEKSPQKITMTEFHEMNSDQSTSEHGGCAVSPRTWEKYCGTHQGSEAYP